MIWLWEPAGNDTTHHPPDVVPDNRVIAVPGEPGRRECWQGNLLLVRVLDHVKVVLEAGNVDAARRILQCRRAEETEAAFLLPVASWAILATE